MRIGLMTFALAMAALTIAPAMAQENPCNPCSKGAANPCNPCGKSAANPCGDKAAGAGAGAMNPCHAKHGTTFMVNDPVKRNTVSFTSSAPLEDFTGTTNDVTGYLVFDPTRAARGIRGKLSVSVKSLDTGIPLRNEHMLGSMWLDAKRYPDITYEVDGNKGIAVVKEGNGFRTFMMRVTGIFTLRGTSKRMDVNVRVTHMKESDKTRGRLPGDLLAGRATFEVRLADFGIEGMKGVVGAKVGEIITIRIGLMGNAAAAPEAMNPCNPRARSAANPCNPCSKTAASSRK